MLGRNHNSNTHPGSRNTIDSPLKSSSSILGSLASLNVSSSSMTNVPRLVQPPLADALPKISVSASPSSTHGIKEKALLSLLNHLLSGGTGSTSMSNDVQQLLPLVQRILDSRIASGLVPDELYLASAIKKKLLKEDPTSQKALSFSNSYAKLKSGSSHFNFPAILQFLKSMTDFKQSTSSVSSTNGRLDLSAKLIALEKSDRFPITIEKPSIISVNSSSTSDQLSSSSVYYRKVPSQLTESQLIRDLLFCFQGVDGKYLRYSNISLKYELLPEVQLPSSTAELVFRLSDMGMLYKGIQEGLLKIKQSENLGLVSQSFMAAIDEHLTGYYRIIAILENHVSGTNAYEKNTMDYSKSDHFIIQGSLSLKRLYVWTFDAFQNLRITHVLVSLCSELKGGALISALSHYVSHGDPTLGSNVSILLKKVSVPFYDILAKWVFEGDLCDPWDEFFVGMDGNVADDGLWRSRYYLRHDMIPSFISKDTAKKIFLIGKSLNFIKTCCKDEAYVVERSRLKSVLTSANVLQTKGIVEKAYHETSGHLLNLLFTKYHLQSHFQACKSFLLLGQGDMVQALMDSVFTELSKPAISLYRHNLSSTLESAIRASNASTFSENIHRRLDVRLLEASAGDYGWDIFTLEYQVDAPINAIFTPQAMQHYTRLFLFLWRLKRVENCLGHFWRNEMKGVREPRNHPSIILWNEMNHFVNQLQYYILFEVLEKSWNELMTFVDKRTGDLDLLISAHNRYLNSITTRGLLSTANNVSSMLLSLFETILEGTSVAIQPGSSSLSRPEPLSASGSKFHTQMGNLLSTLSTHTDQHLKLLGVRLNFNEFYDQSSHFEPRVQSGH